ncbi:hypothetical protein [Streptomyces prunicolor]|uniref:hypothetical protein n=1 Tax=Streptomyces prunicolor TaxID=67348 RepID=UPI0033DC89DA
MSGAKPPACEWLASPVHALTYARLYPSGWWCAHHTPNRQAGRPDPPPGPGWPVYRQPPHGTDPEVAAPTGAEQEQEPS